MHTLGYDRRVLCERHSSDKKCCPAECMYTWVMYVHVGMITVSAVNGTHETRSVVLQNVCIHIHLCICIYAHVYVYV